MNTRIKILAVKHDVHLKLADDDATAVYLEKLERFALDIIDRCIGFAEIDDEDTAARAAASIKKHFFVGEPYVYPDERDHRIASVYRGRVRATVDSLQEQTNA